MHTLESTPHWSDLSQPYQRWKSYTQIQHEAHDAVEEMVMIARYVTHMISMVSPAVVFEIKNTILIPGINYKTE